MSELIVPGQGLALPADIVVGRLRDELTEAMAALRSARALIERLERENDALKLRLGLRVAVPAGAYAVGRAARRRAERAQRRGGKGS